jgi:5'-deoxynucleotidase YfbR-like HD superfamily hydrolase
MPQELDEQTLTVATMPTDSSHRAGWCLNRNKPNIPNRYGKQMSNVKEPLIPAAAVFDPPALMRTVSGRIIDLRDPDPESINIDDIAHALSIEPRFAGHTPKLYTVAQHSLQVSVACQQFPLEALLHDAAEYLLKDIPKPLKQLLGETYAVIERRLEFAICQRFRLRRVAAGEVLDWPAAVHRADRFILQAEMHDLLGVGELPKFADFDLVPTSLSRIEPLPTNVVKPLFLTRFSELTRR